MTSQKPDAPFISQKLRLLQTYHSNRDTRIWPYFLFHFTNITNIPKILQAGRLYSRASLEAQTADFDNTASGEILGHTQERWKDYVRFYFRPQTPMLYNTEGIRPDPGKMKFPDAHCTVPVYLLFSNEPILTNTTTLFSDGNLASSSSHTYSTGLDFNKLPFDDIYHVGAITDGRNREITNRRHAEVIVPQSIGLEHLSYIGCRSVAERETLKNLLGEALWRQWYPKIHDGLEHNFFYSQWVYIEQVDLKAAQLIVHFHPPKKSEDGGLFRIHVKISDNIEDDEYETTFNFTVTQTQKTVGVNFTKLLSYTVSISLNDHLAYKGSYREMDDIPF
jgi:hypothetical protein